MSTYIENNNHNNYSQYLSTCEAPQDFSIKLFMARFIARVMAKAKFWAERSRQRKQLSLLDPWVLADMGITEEQAKIEIAKPFWK